MALHDQETDLRRSLMSGPREETALNMAGTSTRSPLRFSFSNGEAGTSMARTNTGLFGHQPAANDDGGYYANDHNDDYDGTDDDDDDDHDDDQNGLELIIDAIQTMRHSSFTVFIAVTLSFITDNLLYDMMVPILGNLLGNVGMDPANVSVMFVAYALGYLIFAPIFGAISDIYRQRKGPIIFGQSLLSICPLVFIITKSPAVLLITRFFQGVATAALRPVGSALLADVFPTAQLGTILGSVVALAGIGRICTPLLASFLTTNVGWESPFILCSILAMPTLTLFLIIDPPCRASRNSIMSAGSSRALSMSRSARRFKSLPVGQKASHLSYQIRPRRRSSSVVMLRSNAGTVVNFTIWQFIMVPEVLILCCVRIFVAISSSGMETMFPNHLRNAFGMDSWGVSLGSFVIISPNVVFSWLGGIWSDCVDRFSMMFVSLCALTLAPAMIGLAPNIVLLMLAALWFGAWSALTLAPLAPELSATVQRLGVSSHGLAFALLDMASAIGMLAGSPIAYNLNHLIGFSMAMLVISAILLFLVPFLGYFAKRSLKGELTQNGTTVVIEPIKEELEESLEEDGPHFENTLLEDV